MSITLIAMAAAAASHTVSITHHGTSMQALYTARADVEARTVGAKTPNRMDMQRCKWTATVVVDRKLDHGPALARTIASDTRFSGSESGACARNDSLEQRVLAQHRDRIQATVMAMAERDQAPLMAELDSVRALASN